MATYGQAEAARDAVLSRIRAESRPPWLRGAGVTQLRDGSYAVKVNVSRLTDGIRALVPESQDGVPVTVDEVGDVGALEGGGRG